MKTLIALALLLTVAVPARAQDAPWIAYVANSGDQTISVVNLDTSAVLRVIPIGTEIGGLAAPASEPYVYVSKPQANEVALIDRSTHTLVGRIPTGAHPRALSSDVLPGVVLVDVQDAIEQVSGFTRQVTKHVALAGSGRALAATSYPIIKAFVAGCAGSNTVTLVNIEFPGTQSVAVGQRPCAVATRSTYPYVFVANRDDDTVSILDSSTLSVLSTVAVGDEPRGLTIDSFLFVANRGNSVMAVEPSAPEVRFTIPVPGEPHSIVPGQPGTLLVTSSASAQLHVIGTTTTSIVRSITVGPQPTSVVAFQQPPRSFRVDVSSDGTPGDAASLGASISGDGRWIALTSAATTLIAGDTNGLSDVFVHDRLTRRTVRVSVASSGAQAEGGPANGSPRSGSYGPSLSPTGRFVLFSSMAANLVAGDTNGEEDVFVHDRDVDEDGLYDEPGQISTVRVSVQSDGSQATCRVPPQPSQRHTSPRTCSDADYDAVLSANGRYVAFETFRELTPDDTNGRSDVYVRDLLTGRTTRITRRPDGSPTSGDSGKPVIDGSGRFVGFDSWDAALEAGDTNNTPDAFLVDRDADGNGAFDEAGGVSTRRISLQQNGSQLSLPMTVVALSVDGRWISFGAMLGGTGTYGIFDRVTGAVRMFPEQSAYAAYGRGQFSGDNRYLGFTALDNYSFGSHTFVFDRDADGNGQFDTDVSNTEFYGPALPRDTTFRYAFLGGGFSELRVVDLANSPSDTFDSDADGLANDFETRFGLSLSSAAGDDGPSGDPDHDGRTNAQEQEEGTHPRGFFTRYLAEGATGTFFSTRVAVANPQATTANVLLRYQTGTGHTTSTPLAIAPEHRRSVYVDNKASLSSADFSTVIESDVEVVADRSMFWNDNLYGSHAEASIASPATRWYLAEGATHGGFDLFYLIQNPNPTEAADVDVRFLLPAGAPVVRTYRVAPASRFNIYVDRVPGLEAADVSAVLTSTNAVPIIVERAMYFSRPDLPFAAGHESAGVTDTSTQWFLAEGATGSFFDLFVLIANPNPTAAELRISYLLPDGRTVVKTRTVAPESRTTIYVEAEDPALLDTAVSTIVESTNGAGVIVERSMWWPAGGSGWQEAHNSPGATAPVLRWGFADGEAGGPPVNTQTYYLIANPGDVDATVRVKLLFEDSTAPASRTFTVRAHSRFNVAAASAFPAAQGKAFGAVIESLGETPAPIVVERAMYSDAAGMIWAAGTNVLGSRLR